MAVSCSQDSPSGIAGSWAAPQARNSVRRGRRGRREATTRTSARQRRRPPRRRSARGRGEAPRRHESGRGRRCWRRRSRRGRHRRVARAWRSRPDEARADGSAAAPAPSPPSFPGEARSPCSRPHRWSTARSSSRLHARRRRGDPRCHTRRGARGRLRAAQSSRRRTEGESRRPQRLLALACRPPPSPRALPRSEIRPEDLGSRRARKRRCPSRHGRRRAPRTAGIAKVWRRCRLSARPSRAVEADADQVERVIHARSGLLSPG